MFLYIFSSLIVLLRLNNIGDNDSLAHYVYEDNGQKL